MSKKTTIRGKPVNIELWDTAGQERHQSIGNVIYRGTNCCILVFDVSERETFERLERWKQIFLDNVSVDDPASFPFVVIGNKKDTIQQSRQVTTL